MKGNCKLLRVFTTHFVMSVRLWVDITTTSKSNMPGLTGNPIPEDGLSSLDCLNQVGQKPNTKPSFRCTLLLLSITSFHAAVRAQFTIESLVILRPNRSIKSRWLITLVYNSVQCVRLMLIFYLPLASASHRVLRMARWAVLHVSFTAP